MSGIAQWALDLDDSGPVAIIPPKGKDYSHVTYQYAKVITKTHENFGKDNAVRFIGSTGQIDVQRGKLETSPGARATQMIGPNEQHMYSSEDHYKN
jgi:ABC-type Fe3+ transport system substrate-binding protein